VINNAQSLKDKAKNIAKEKKLDVQVVLQNYMFERFIERLSKSQFKNNFILKGRIFIIFNNGNRYEINHGYRCKHYRH